MGCLHQRVEANDIEVESKTYAFIGDGSSGAWSGIKVIYRK
jgi:hypothetical protein